MNQKLREVCFSITKKAIAEAVTDDIIIIQVISAIEESDGMINKLITRLREWYAWYNPELVHSLQHEKIAELIIAKDKKTLLREIGIDEKNSMGGTLNTVDIDAIRGLAMQVQGMIDQRDAHKLYLETVLDRHCPNLKTILGVTLTGKLIRHAGSIERLIRMPAPVIQILGAEKALFKHMTTKAKSPKYGLIFSHPIIAQAHRTHKGKAARAVADKAAMAVKIDFFKGEFIGRELKAQLEKKVKSWK